MSDGGRGGTATFDSGFSCIALNPTAVNAAGLGLQGRQFNWVTPRTLSANLTFQYAITRTLSAQVAYVLTDGMNLESFIGANNVTAILPQGSSTTISPALGGLAFPDFASNASYASTIGASIYNGLQTKLEQQFSNGLNFLLTYTWAKGLSDAGDLLNGGSVNGYRAPEVPGFGPRFDWGLADFNIKNVVHFSGSYNLPFGTGQHFAGNANKAENYLIGGWSGNWIMTFQGGQPISLGCPTGTTAGTNCYRRRGSRAVREAGQERRANQLGNTSVLVQ